MNLIRNPKINAAIVLVITMFYSLVFILTSGHLEFERILCHANTLNSSLWNFWSEFLIRGHLKYIGYVFIALALAIVILSLIRIKGYDEYQTSILQKGLVSAGVILLCLFPLTLLLILSEPNYAIEAITMLVVVHWSAVLIAELVYTLRWSKT